MSGKHSRNKGAAFERKLAIEFREMGWEKAKRHLEFQAEEAELGQDLDGTDPFMIQAKCYAKPPNPLTILAQIKEQQGKFKLGIIKQTNKGEYIVMHKEEFYELLSMLKKEEII